MTIPTSRWCVLFPLLLASACSSTHRTTPSYAPTTNAGTSHPPTQLTPTATGLVAKSISEMAPTDVIVAVNDVPFTRQVFDAGVAYIAQKVASRPGMNKQSQARMRLQIARKMIPDFIKRQLLLQEARRLDVKPLKESLDRNEKEIAKAAEGLSMTADEFRKSTAPQVVFVRQTLEAVPLAEALIKEKVAPKVNITDEMVTNTIATIDEENKGVEKRNEEKRALLRKLRTQVAEGADFKTLADKHSEAPRYDPGDASYWGTFTRSEIADRDMSDAIFNLKSNEVSEVLSDEEGFHLVRMIKKTPAIKNDSQEVVQRESCEVAQILLVREPSLNNMLPPMMKKELVRQTAGRLTSEYVSELAAQARIVYPHGTNFWKQVPTATNAPVRKTRAPSRMAPDLKGLPSSLLPGMGTETTSPLPWQ